MGGGVALSFYSEREPLPSMLPLTKLDNIPAITVFGFNQSWFISWGSDCSFPEIWGLLPLTWTYQGSVQQRGSGYRGDSRKHGPQVGITIPILQTDSLKLEITGSKSHGWQNGSPRILTRVHLILNVVLLTMARYTVEWTQDWRDAIWLSTKSCGALGSYSTSFSLNLLISKL